MKKTVTEVRSYLDLKRVKRQEKSMRNSQVKETLSLNTISARLNVGRDKAREIMNSLIKMGILIKTVKCVSTGINPKDFNKKLQHHYASEMREYIFYSKAEDKVLKRIPNIYTYNPNATSAKGICIDI